jgi:tryptophanyl-tRNA synthetase
MTEIPKLTGLDGRKMSKSYGNVLLISDPPDIIRKKILTMVTCPHRIKRTDPGHPEHCPVFTLHELYSSKEERGYATDGCTKASIGCVDCKNVLINNIVNYMAPIHKKREEYSGNLDLVMDILKKGNEKAREVAQETMEIVRKAIFK